MHVLTTLPHLHAWRASLAQAPVFVPTMGNLHEGHLSLVAQAQALAADTGAPVVASIFVNRLQFAPNEDFDAYPRTLANDVQLLEGMGCNALFAPAEIDLYPQPQAFHVVPPTELANVLEGEFRPGFFTGVCTVVHKLFNIVQPQAAVFGKKDYQQLMVIRRMVAQMALPIAIHGGETLRDPDGLALSSRNAYLSSEERAQATQLIAVLRHLQQQVQTLRQTAQLTPSALLDLQDQAMQTLHKKAWAPDYVEVRKQVDLSLLNEQDVLDAAPLVVLAAARLGRTRLIDNLEVI
jgi:pantoate--beta-alanine ligase